MYTELDFPTTIEYPKEIVKKLQSRLLEMAKIATKILDDNDFKYFIAFGTLLGAVRHNGFIPWDDDFDLFLFDDEYDAAVECLRNNLPTDIIVHDKLTDPIYWPAWSRLRDINTSTTASLFPDDNNYKFTGINLDLYRLKRVKSHEIDVCRKKEYLEYIVRKHDAKLIDDVKYIMLFNQTATEYSDMLKSTSTTDYSEDVYSFVFGLRECKHEELFPLKKCQFEDAEFWGPNNPDVILTQTYGEYMAIPPYEKRNPHYTEVIFKDM